MNADQRVSLLSMVSPQIEATLNQVLQAAATHATQSTGNSILTNSPAHIHQVAGALRMTQLDGAARYCAELEAALRNSMRSGAPDQAEIECITRGISALLEFLGDVEAGGPYVPMRLYPAYRDLLRVSGNESASEKDLFVPETPDASHPPPVHAEPRTITPAVLPALLKELRSRYQRGLLSWLKESAKPDGLVHMHDVLDTLHRISAQLPEPRGLWWAAVVLIDAAIETLAVLPDTRKSEWLARVKPACSRIDFALRDLAARLDADTSVAFRDVLYAIAIADAPTPRMREVRACFHLDDLLPTVPSSDGGGTAALKPAVDDACTRLDNIKDTWSEYTAGEPNRLGQFRDMQAMLTAKSQILGNAPLTGLLEAIGAAAANLPDPYPGDSQMLSLEMASALLMAEGIVRNFDTLPSDLEQQVAIMRHWLADAAKGKITTICPPGLRTDIVQKVNDEKVRTIIAREVLQELAQVEKAIEVFTRDRSERAVLLPPVGTLRQISGVLQISNQKRASRLAMLCQRLLERCADPAHAAMDVDIEWVAEGLGSLGFYLEPCVQGKLPTERAVNLFFTRYEKNGGDPGLVLTQSLLAAAPGAPAQERYVALARPGIDPDMLDVFLEEANEVLDTIESASAELNNNHNDQDALLSVRRAFHMLKGSARMVGLVAFGDCAWEMEQLMNHWRSQSQVATPELLALVKDTREMLAEWTYALQGGEEPAADPASIVARARALRGMPAMSESPPTRPPASITVAEASPGIPAEPAPSPSGESEPLSATHEFMTVTMPSPTAATGQEFMTVMVPAAAPDSVEQHPPSPAELCDQALADLGDRLEWLTGLIEEISTQTSTNVQANARLREIAHMMEESMTEAASLHQALREHIDALKNAK